MKSYHDLAKRVLEEGVRSPNRTGTDTISIFGAHWEHDLAKGFPLLTTKKVYFRGVVAELLWFLRGETNIELLHKWKCKIWDEWADVHGNLGPIYGRQWRDFDGWSGGAGVDQIKGLIENLRNDPQSRRHIVSAWNPNELTAMALPPCHVMFQCNVTNDGRLDLQWYQRSWDLFLGGPFNIASYALLTHLLAREVGLKPGKLRCAVGDCHLYDNHLTQIREQLDRIPKQLPELSISDDAPGMLSMHPEDISVQGYYPYPPIKAPVAV